MPPAPSSERISYCPSIVPAVRDMTSGLTQFLLARVRVSPKQQKNPRRKGSNSASKSSLGHGGLRHFQRSVHGADLLRGAVHDADAQVVASGRQRDELVGRQSVGHYGGVSVLRQRGIERIRGGRDFPTRNVEGDP